MTNLNSFLYQGQTVHRQSETGLICLTDLWQVQGSIFEKTPLDWVRLKTTQKLLKGLVEPNETVVVWSESEAKGQSSANEPLIAEVPGVLEVTQEEDELRTYATEELAVVYARFLSVDCYEWALENLVEGDQQEADYLESVETRTKARRQKQFSRRALIAAGWAVPVVLSVGLQQKAVAAGSGHNDHNDNYSDHSDNHSDNHSDSTGQDGFSPQAQQTYTRLEDEPWVKDSEIEKALKDNDATLQKLADGYGDTKLDEYSFVIDKMPPGETPENFLSKLLGDMNGTVNNETFNKNSEFDKKANPQKGDIFDIDIYGPDNGSVMLTEKYSSAFTFSTVTTKTKGTHPENGSREFGFNQNTDGSVTFYTRGTSKATDIFHTIGNSIQKETWTAWSNGLQNTISKNGGNVRPNSFNLKTSTKK
jgi:hypothetical protein